MGQVNSQQDESSINITKLHGENPSSAYGNIESNSTKSTLNEKTKVSDSSRKIFVRLGTIRRRLARSLRAAKNSDHRKNIRDLLQNWTIHEIKSFVREYEGLEALKDLLRLSDSARYKCHNISDDMSLLYEEGFLSDARVSYKEVTYSVHKNFLLSRHNFFSTCFEKGLNELGNYEIPCSELDLSNKVFGSLIKYIYSGTSKDSNLIQILPELEKTYGKVNPLNIDLISLHNKKCNTDLKLTFENEDNTSSSSSEDEDCLTETNNLEIHCHTFMLCARSKFFKSCLGSCVKSSTKFVDDVTTLPKHANTDKPFELVINEKIIPRSYIRVVLNCFYTDIVDISSIIKWKVADDGSGEADRLLTNSELAMELYEIGHFLEFPKLMQGCEDIIVSNFNISTLLNVMDWSYQPHGSDYVHRQAMQYFREEFQFLCKAAVFLANIPKKFLLEAIKSDFLQASEEFILATVIKWGEWQIAKSNEKPGTSPANSLPRRSPKRRDIDNKVLLNVIADLLPFIRLKHILPPNSPVLHSCYQRGLLQRPFPCDVLSAEKNMPSMAFWLRDCRYKHYQRPRLFTQYMHEVKIVLHERLTENDHNGCASRHRTGTLPDMLLVHRISFENKTSQHMLGEQQGRVGGGLSVLDIMQLEPCIIKQMVLREKELKNAEETLKALSLAPDSYEIGKAIQLRVVREFGFPDEIAEKIFQQTPDLIEESSSSGSSSKHSTLSRVSHLMKDKITLSREASSVSNDSRLSNISHVIDHVPTQDELLQRTTQLLNNKDKSTILQGTNQTMQCSPVRSIEDSPLDLPLTESCEIQLPNVLLDT